MGVKKSLAEESHKPIRRKFKKRRVLVNGIDKLRAADLVDMQAFTKFNRGVKYLLTVIDVFSKYGCLIPLKDKTEKSVASALKTIFKERKPEKMWVDKVLCTYLVILSLHMCVFIFSFPCGYF